MGIAKAVSQLGESALDEDTLSVALSSAGIKLAPGVRKVLKDLVKAQVKELSRKGHGGTQKNTTTGWLHTQLDAEVHAASNIRSKSKKPKNRLCRAEERYC